MSHSPQLRPDATAILSGILAERILVLDGAMGTMIQRHTFSEAEYRGERFADWHRDLQGNNDLLTLTQPETISAIHRAYLDAGVGPDRDQHLQRPADLAGRLRHGGRWRTS